MANRRRDVGKERFWRDVLKRQAGSGISVRAFCRREQLGEASFHGWRRVLRLRDAERRPNVRAGARHPAAAAFVPMKVIEPAPREASIEIELAGGRVLRLPSSIAAARLAELVQALEGRAAR